MEQSQIKRGTRVKVVKTPALSAQNVHIGDVGVAQDEPNLAGTFWALFPGGQFAVRANEVKVAKP